MAVDLEAIERLLPQTQCERCGYAGCTPYAEAMRDGDDHNKCAPGGAPVMQALSQLLGRATLALDDPVYSQQPLSVAVIDESQCIGCTICLKACPVDAIVGAAKRMHTVIANECTGCELCITPCPMDCISLVPHPIGRPTWHLGDAHHQQLSALWRQRHDQHHARWQHKEQQRKQRQLAQMGAAAAGKRPDLDTKTYLQAALAKAKDKRRAQDTPTYEDC